MNAMRLYLAQTDTTVGFLSQDSALLARAKERSPSQPFLITYDSFASFKKDNRAPTKHKNRIRRAKKSTFIVKNRASRIAKEALHVSFLRRFGWMYSTSANKTGERFDYAFATKRADIVIEDSRGLFEQSASAIYSLSNRTLRRVR